MEKEKALKSEILPQEMKPNEQEERSEYIFDLVNGWIENADNKVSVSCGIFGGIFGVLSFVAEKVGSNTVQSDWLKAVVLCLSIASFVCFAVAMLFYVLAINPSLCSKKKSAKSKDGIKIDKMKYPIYFGDVAGMNLKEYLKKMERASADQFVQELQREIHFNSCICYRKMKRFKAGLWFSFVAIFITILSLSVLVLLG